MPKDFDFESAFYDFISNHWPTLEGRVSKLEGYSKLGIWLLTAVLAGIIGLAIRG